jgi:hypothetical protein
LDIPIGTHDAVDRMTADHDVNLESGTPKVGNRRRLLAEGSCSNLSCRKYVRSRASVLQELSELYISVNSLCGLIHRNAKIGDGLKDNHFQ